MKLTITKLYKSDKSKDGKLLITKDGRPYVKIGILTREYGANRWLSGFESQSNYHWKEGDIIDAQVEEVTSNGKVYLNFHSLGKLELLESRVEILEKTVFGERTINK